VVRDKEGVPHIFAKTTDDLYLALGFVHAQDRLWQMELQRRTGQGRLSEIFGERTFTTDVFLRTLDLYGHAER
jgi:penicillin amidase